MFPVPDFPFFLYVCLIPSLPAFWLVHILLTPFDLANNLDSHQIVARPGFIGKWHALLNALLQGPSTGTGGFNDALLTAVSFKPLSSEVRDSSRPQHRARPRVVTEEIFIKGLNERRHCVEIC